jgi:hypothetical protein
VKPFKIPKNYKRFELPKAVEMAPAPMWSMRVGEPALQTVYADHYYRMLSVIAAARSGDRILVKLALENYDAKGCKPESAA